MTIKSTLRTVDVSDRPFGLPLEIVLDLPAPPSVNRTRKVDFKSLRMVNEWKYAADALVMATRRPGDPRRIRGQFELLITISNTHTRVDLDNGLKSLIDYLRRIEVIEDDSPKFMRRITIEWGTAPEGCRVTVRPYP